MAEPIEHPQANCEFHVAPGDDDRVGSIKCHVRYKPGANQVSSITTAWRLNPSELDEIARTGIVMVNSLYGLAPQFVATESVMREVVLDQGSDRCG